MLTLTVKLNPLRLERSLYRAVSDNGKGYPDWHRPQEGALEPGSAHPAEGWAKAVLTGGRAEIRCSHSLESYPLDLEALQRALAMLPEEWARYLIRGEDLPTAGAVLLMDLALLGAVALA